MTDPTPAVPGAMAMTDERLAELIALDAKATPGPWFVLWDEDYPWVVEISSDEAGDNRVAHMFHNNGRDDERDGATATLIVLLRNSFPTMAAELTRLRAQVREGEKVRAEAARLREGAEHAHKHLESDVADSIRRSRAMLALRAALTPQPAPTEGGKG